MMPSARAAGRARNGCNLPLPINSRFRLSPGPRLGFEPRRQEFRGFVVGPVQVLNPDGREALVTLKPQVVPFVKPMHPKGVGLPVNTLAPTEGRVNQPKGFGLGVEDQIMRPKTHRGGSYKPIVVAIREGKDPRAVLRCQAAT